MEIIRRAATKPKQLYTIEPEEYDVKETKGTVAVFDTETDPFAGGRIVAPFSCGFYIPSIEFYVDFWGDDCIRQFIEWLDRETSPEGMFPKWEFSVFVHNGGNFDFYFLVEHFDEGMKPFIINGRLVRISIHGHEFRDSYAMIPVALGNALKAEDGGKIEIDYAKMEREVRETHKAEILHYQKQDCVALGKLVTEWLDMFGNRMTMASVALPMLRSFHGFENMSEYIDNMMRPYYFGGRCQAFETGVIRGKFKGYDINSSYPDVMRRVMHPISDTPNYERRITSKTHFAKIRAYSKGALPVRRDDGGLDFPIGEFDFFACIHEINAGIATGTLRIKHVYESIYFTHEATFADFIDTFYERRLKAGEDGDEIKKLFYKLVMNSSYGKFAQDPRKYENWLFNPVEIPTPLLCMPCNTLALEGKAYEQCDKCKSKSHDPFGWYLHTDKDGFCIYARPQRIRGGKGFFNVATAASITSAARASLLYGINASTRPLYCDTDSLICEALDAELDNKKLGAWKFEFEADTVAIAGKKMYACFSGETEVKKASKGVRLTANQIVDIAKGDTIEYANPVPKFSIFKPANVNTIEVGHGVTAEFVTRRIRATGKSL